MIWLLATLAILVFLALILTKLTQSGRVKQSEYPYHKTDTLFSPAERSFYGVLVQTVGANIKIFGKVRVADLVIPQKGLSRSDWQKAFNKIAGKHIDFILCNSDNLSVICAIELDDRSHQAAERQRRDEFIRGVCDKAKIPLIHITAKASYAVNDIRQQLSPYLSGQNQQ